MEQKRRRLIDLSPLGEAATARIAIRGIGGRRIGGIDHLGRTRWKCDVRFVLHRIDARCPVPIDIGNQRAKGLLDVGRIQSRCFDVSKCNFPLTSLAMRWAVLLNVSLVRVTFGIVIEHGAYMPLVGLVSNENYTAIATGIRSYLIVPKRKIRDRAFRFFFFSKGSLLPLIEILECRCFENIENNESTQSIPVVGFGYCHEALLSS